MADDPPPREAVGIASLQDEMLARVSPDRFTKSRMPGLMMSVQQQITYEISPQQFQYMAMDDSHLWPEWHGSDDALTTGDVRHHGAVRKLVAFFERKRRRADGWDDGRVEGMGRSGGNGGVKLAVLPSKEMMMGCPAAGLAGLEDRWWGSVEVERLRDGNDCLCIGCEGSKCPLKKGGVKVARRRQWKEWHRSTIRIVTTECDERDAWENGTAEEQHDGVNWYSVSNADAAPYVPTVAASIEVSARTPALRKALKWGQSAEKLAGVDVAPWLNASKTSRSTLLLDRPSSLQSVPEEDESEASASELAASPSPALSSIAKPTKLLACASLLEVIPEEDESEKATSSPLGFGSVSPPSCPPTKPNRLLTGFSRCPTLPVSGSPLSSISEESETSSTIRPASNSPPPPSRSSTARWAKLLKRTLSLSSWLGRNRSKTPRLPKIIITPPPEDAKTPAPRGVQRPVYDQAFLWPRETRRRSSRSKTRASKGSGLGH